MSTTILPHLTAEGPQDRAAWQQLLATAPRSIDSVGRATIQVCTASDGRGIFATVDYATWQNEPARGSRQDSEQQERKQDMTTTNHTPGPWRQDPSYWADIDAPCGTQVGMVHSDHDVDGAPDAATAQANARLIAAAPDMLTRLEGVLITAANMLGELNSGRDIPAAVLRLELENLLRDTQAAIAKARG